MKFTFEVPDDVKMDPRKVRAMLMRGFLDSLHLRDGAMSDDNKVTAFEAHEVQVQGLNAEAVRVRALGEAIGYGNMMVLAQRLWAEDLKTKYGLDGGGAFAVYCCETFLVPCPGCKKVESPKDCDWCCGAKRVTQKVAEAIQRLEPAT